VKNQSETTRRKFLKGTAAAVTIPMFMPNSVFGANNKINLAWVGFKNQGGGDLHSCQHGNNVVALCDVNDHVLQGKGKQFKKAKLYKDFRKMLDEMDKEIEAVGVGTPDHVHFAITYKAMKMNKHVFVEKPLVHSLEECRTLQERAKENKDLATQMGDQGHAFEEAMLIKEWYDGGLIGEVKEVLAWTNRPKNGWGFPGHPGGGHKEYAEAQEVPKHLDWELWRGAVAKDIKYNHTYALSRQGCWRPWWDFGCGGLGDIGCHTIDAPWWALGMGAPEAVEVEMKYEANPIYTPNGSIVTYKFPGKNGKPGHSIKWLEAPSRPTAPEGYDDKVWGVGGMIMPGTKGGICHPDMRPNGARLYPKGKWQEYRSDKSKQVPKTLRRPGSIHRDWIEGIRNSRKSCSDFSYACPLTEVILLGTLAIRTGKGFKWNSEKMEITGNDEAAKMIDIPARKGWRVEDL